MTKSPRFESKTSEDMYRSLDEVEEVEARRRVRMMDPTKVVGNDWEIPPENIVQHLHGGCVGKYAYG